jgi:hypothetical protein
VNLKEKKIVYDTVYRKKNRERIEFSKTDKKKRKLRLINYL